MSTIAIPHPLAHYTVIDLTYLVTSNTPTWEGYCGFRHSLLMDYPRGCRVQSVHMRSGAGTHIDAPAHFIPGGKDVASLALQDLIVPIVVIDVRHKVHADYYITRDDVIAFEQQYGDIAPHSFVIGYTGWEQYWETDHYRNVDAEGQMHFPGFSPDSVAHLLARDIAGLGIDTLSPDCLDLTFPVHHAILGKEKYIVENLANCGQLPPTGSFAMLLPMKAHGLTEAPIRALGLIPKR